MLTLSLPTLPTSSMPRAHAVPRRGQLRSESTEYGGSSESSSGSEGERGNAARGQRPRLHSRKSSGTIIVPRDAATELIEEHYDENDARTMSPRRSSEEVDRLEEGARQALIEQAKALQQSLLQLVDRVESVKSEHEKLEGGNRFLQSYIGELMQTSKITSAGPPKGKGKGRMAK